MARRELVSNQDEFWNERAHKERLNKIGRWIKNPTTRDGDFHLKMSGNIAEQKRDREHLEKIKKLKHGESVEVPQPTQTKIEFGRSVKDYNPIVSLILEELSAISIHTQNKTNSSRANRYAEIICERFGEKQGPRNKQEKPEEVIERIIRQRRMDGPHILWYARV